MDRTRLVHRRHGWLMALAVALRGVGTSLMSVRPTACGDDRVAGVRDPERSRNRSLSRAAISPTGSTRSRAAASSIANGSPSSRRTISTTGPTVRSSSTKSALAADPRAISSATAGYAAACPRDPLTSLKSIMQLLGRTHLLHDRFRFPGR